MRPSALRSFRLLQGLSLYDVALRVGLSESMLSLVERGRRKLSRDDEEKVAAALGQDVGELFPRDADAEDAG